METREVDVVFCNDIECFETFVEMQEKVGTGRKDGVFKIRFDSRYKNYDENHVLTSVLGSMKNIHSQILSKGRAQNIYQFTSLDANSEDRRNFIDEASKMSSYSTKTCCSIILEENGCDDLIRHFFEHEVKPRVEAAEQIQKADTMKRLLQQGATLKRKYLSQDTNQLMLSCIKKREQPELCDCRDCDDGQDCEDLNCSEPFALYAAGVSLDKNHEPIFISKSFSLSRLKNILLLLDHFYPGLTLPYFYIGKTHSFAPLHIEDCSLWSINFLHFGQPKIWIVVPSEAVLLLMYHLSKSKLSIGDTSCWNFLGHKTAFPHPTWLKERNIPYKIVVQNAGEAVIVYPEAAHLCWNTGWNLAQAVNFATISWIEIGMRSLRCQCIPYNIHLDLGKIIAAFRPDLLSQWLHDGGVTSQSEEEMATILQSALKVPEKLTIAQECSGSGFGIEMPMENINDYPKEGDSTSSVSNNRFFECPVTICKRKYPFGSKKRIETHVRNKHRPLLVKCNLLENINQQHIAMKIMKNKKLN